MEDFDELRRRLSHVNVKAPDYGDAYGALSLDGEDSSIELNGKIPLFDISHPGMFNLILNAAGSKIYIYKALRTSMSFPSRTNDSYSIKLFPNIVIDNADAVDIEGNVRCISFRLESWEKLFPYNYFEAMDIFGNITESQKKELEKFRYEFNKKEPFSPFNIYVFNDLGTIIEFQIDGRRYSISTEVRQSFGSRDRLDGQVRMIGTITFPHPVNLDHATDTCWDWRRFFNQLSMGAFPFAGMAVSAGIGPTSPWGNVYLPLERSTKLRRSSRSADAYHMPWNQWNERAAAGEAMQAWLKCQEKRSFFRAALDRVLARPGHVAIEDAVALCAGIDTLPELSSRDSLPTAVLDSMTQAAVSAAAKENFALDDVRIRGLLGSIQNDDLRRRLRRLGSIAAPEVSEDALERWIDVIVPLRVFGAHGRIPKTDNNLIEGPAVDALAALCARFDLQSAGVPDELSNNSFTLPRKEWDESLMIMDMQRRFQENPEIDIN